MKNLSYLATAWLIITALSGCGGSGSSTTATAPTDTAKTASYVGTWDVTLSQDNICSTGENSIPFSASITEDGNGELTLWFVDGDIQTVSVLTTVSGANATWTGQEMVLDVGSLAILFDTAADLTIEADSISGTMDYSANLVVGGLTLFPSCNGVFNVAATLSNADTAPDAPTTLTVANPTATSLDLSWDNAGNEWGYTISRMGPDDSDYVKIATVGMNVLSYTDNALLAETRYYYEVEAYNNLGVSTAATADDITAIMPSIPLAPSALATTSILSTSISLEWTDNATDEVDIVVRYCQLPFFGDVCVERGTTLLGVDASVYTLTNLLPETRYSLAVYAQNSAGQSAWDIVEVTTDTLPKAPTAPSDLLTGLVTDTSIAISWTDNSSIEENMEVKYCKALSFPLKCLSYIASLPADSTSHTLDSLIPETTYDISVCASNPGGSACLPMEQISTTVKTTIPVAPTSLSATTPLRDKLTGTYSVTLSWLDNSDNEDNFVLEVDDGNKLTKPVITTLAANMTTYTLRKIPAGSGTYYVRVKAVNTAGSSAYSKTVTVKIPLL